MRIRLMSAVAASALVLAACGGDPTENATGDDEGGGTVRIGSADFPENEIIAEIYAQALEANDVTVERNLRIGAREAYVPALQEGSIDLIPEYSGNLLTYFSPEGDETEAEAIIAALDAAVPEELTVLEPAEAENKDSLNVTGRFAEQNGVRSIGDLADVDELTVAGPPEFETRANGLPGMAEVYGIEDPGFRGISDGGGPTTLRALLDGDVDVANIFSTTPSIAENDLVTLEDPKSLFPAQNVIPLMAADAASDEITEVLDEVSAELTTEDLLELNGRNQGEEKAQPATLAEEWLADAGIV